jgi:ketosteroid isomerase-like protein
MTSAGGVTEEQLDELIAIVDEATAAYIRGDVRHYLSLFDHADDYTLMAPYGGEVMPAFARTEEQLDETSRYFATGEGSFDLDQAYVSGDQVVLVGVERQHGEVGGRPDQDWSLRVTWVFRREGSEWRQVHRHADSLVHSISLEQVAALARG